MKNKRKQSPTLAELLDPFLRNPPSPPPSTAPQLPQSLIPRSSPTVSVNPRKCSSRRCTGADRRFAVDTPQFYRVHPRDFRSLVQRLTGEIRSTTPSGDQPTSMLEERVQVIKNIENVDVDVDVDHTDCYGAMLPVLSPQAMDAVGTDASTTTTKSKKKGECSTYKGCFPP